MVIKSFVSDMQNCKTVLDFWNLIWSCNVNFPLAVKSEDNVNMVSITFGVQLNIWVMYLSCKHEVSFLGTETFGLCAGSPQDTVNCYFTADLWVDKLQTGGNIITEVPLCGLFICSA